MNRLILRSLLKLHADSASTPYFDLPGYMLRNWILGARSPDRNGDKAAWNLPGFVAPASNGLYRFICRHVAIRAHTILRSDRDRHLHDHPGWSISIVLTGGYWEVLEPTLYALAAPLMYRAALDTIAQSWIAPEHASDHAYMRQFGIHWRGPGAIVLRRAGDFHRIVLPRGVVAQSIFIVGKKTNPWGFKTAEGKVGWREYLRSESGTVRADKSNTERNGK
jgi:hypothetical protein